MKIFSFPFDIKWSPFFEFIFATSVWSGLVTTAMIFGGDGLFFGLCVHLSSEFEIVGLRVKNLMGEITGVNGEKLTPEQNQEVYEKLTKIVDDHKDVIELCQKVSRSLSTNVLIHYISAALITCICCLSILLAEGVEKIVFINYIGASTTQAFIYSFGGQILADSSSKIQEFAYNFEWYKTDVKNRKLIQMMMLRAQKRAAVEVPFFQTSLETFASVSKKWKQFQSFPY